MPPDGTRTPATGPFRLDLTPVTWPALGTYALGVVTLGALSVLRQSGTPPWRSLWAEDGSFLFFALHSSFLELALEPYHGYANAMPRVMAALAAALPLELAPLVLSAGSALIVASLAAFTYRAARTTISSAALRAALAAAPVLAPVTLYESLNNAANLHFFLLFAAYWALIWVPKGWVLRILAAAIILVSGMSGPMTVFLAPVVGMRVWAVRDVSHHLQTAAWAVGTAVQGLIALSAGPEDIGGVNLADLVEALAVKVAAVTLLGLPLTELVWQWLGAALVPMAILGLALILWHLAVRSDRDARVSGLMAAAVGILLLFSAYFLRWLPEMRLTDDGINLGAARYLIVPSLLLLVIVAVQLDQRDLRRRIALGRATVAGIAWIALMYGWSFSYVNGRHDAPVWQASLDEAGKACQSDVASAAVIVPISPPGWAIRIPCARLPAER